MKLLKVSDGEGENEKSVMVDLLTSDEGVLPELASQRPTNTLGGTYNLLKASDIGYSKMDM